MNKITRTMTLVAAILLICSTGLLAQKNKKKDKAEGYKFTIEKSVQATAVKDQHRSGTCWSFASTRFIEAELLRTGQGSHDLSEMYCVRKAWELKAD